MNPPTLEDLIERMVASAPPLCAGLIDQGRVMGGDPVGHGCLRPATDTYWRDGLWWGVCAGCLASLEAGEGRVSLPLWRARAGSE
jgi:hypothetical protein